MCSKYLSNKLNFFYSCLLKYGLTTNVNHNYKIKPLTKICIYFCLYAPHQFNGVQLKFIR